MTVGFGKVSGGNDGRGENERYWYSGLCRVAYVMSKYRMPFNEET